MALVAAAMMASAAVVGGDFAADRAECSDKLVGLATCLAYVQDEAAAPTPDCCAGLNTVLQTSRKCLCVLVKDKDDPNLGLKLNVTKALELPALCKASANISDCPSTWPLIIPHHHPQASWWSGRSCHRNHLPLTLLKIIVTCL